MIGLPRLRQAAALPYDISERGRRVLLITSLGTRRWIVPKGNIEPGLTARESAEFEAFEEAGVIGRLASSSIGSFTYEKADSGETELHHVKVFPLEVKQMLDRYPQCETRARQWMTPSEAAAVVDEQALKDLLVKFGESQAV